MSDVWTESARQFLLGCEDALDELVENFYLAMELRFLRATPEEQEQIVAFLAGLPPEEAA